MSFSLAFSSSCVKTQRSPQRGRLSLVSAAKHARNPLEGDTAGPGSGARKFPEDLGQEYEQPSAAKASFECKTTRQCYEEFPYLVHVSVPLSVADKEPAGLSALHTSDAGPSTGHRRRPGVVDAEALQHPPTLPHPAEHKDLKKEVVLRHTPEVVLGEHI